LAFARGAVVPWIVATALVGGTLAIAGVTFLQETPSGVGDPLPVHVVLQAEADGRVSRPAAEAGDAGFPGKAGPPLVLDAALFETTSHGFVPTIAPDGRRPGDVFRRRAPRSPAPRVGLLLVEIGLDEKASARALTGSAALTLVVSPYAPRAGSWNRSARWAGHETLLELPTRPSRFPLDERGPLALEPDGASALDRILARGIGYLGVCLEAGSFEAAPGSFGPIAAALARRGLALVELDADALEPVARRHGLTYLGGVQPIDRDPSPTAIDESLEALRSRAVANGSAVGYGRPFEITLDRIAQWSARLASQGVSLVGIGELLEEPRETIGGVR
jgi:polysaccharide deacetylase 2 family uncharacterized protein YibQ